MLVLHNPIRSLANMQQQSAINYQLISYFCVKFSYGSGPSKNEFLSEDAIERCIQLMHYLCENGDQIGHINAAQLDALRKASGIFSRPDRRERKKRLKGLKNLENQKIKEHNRKSMASTGIRKARTDSVFVAPMQLPEHDPQLKARQFLNSPRNCYICKAEYTEVHHFYDAMCMACGDYNYAKRFQHCDLSGQVALITGSRLKIGYQATLKLLRSGATVIATTRFPVDSALRYSKESDFVDWKDRLHIYGLDLRHIPSVELFVRISCINIPDWIY